jgi:hypothetical protein
MADPEAIYHWHTFAGDPDHDLVEMPVIARPRTALPQLSSNHGAEFQHPTDGVSRRLRLRL